MWLSKGFASTVMILKKKNTESTQEDFIVTARKQNSITYTQEALWEVRVQKDSHCKTHEVAKVGVYIATYVHAYSINHEKVHIYYNTFALLNFILERVVCAVGCVTVSVHSHQKIQHVFFFYVSFFILTVLLLLHAHKAFAEETVHGVAEVVQKRFWRNISPSGLWHSVRLFC